MSKKLTPSQASTLEVIRSYGSAGCSRILQQRGFNPNSVPALFRAKLVETTPETRGLADCYRVIRATDTVEAQS